MHIKQILWERCIGKIVIAMLFTLIWATMGNKSALATMTHANRTLNEVTHQWHLVNFQEDFSGNPIVITSIETYDGSDPSGIRIQELNKGSMEVMIEEEQPYSIEMEHTSEIVSYFAAEEGFLRNTNGSIIGEAGRVIKDQADPTTWHTVNTQKTYTNPVVFAQISTYNGSNPSHIRLKNVKNNSFEMQREEWDYLDGEHTTEDIGYIVMERGSHELAFGKKLEVGITTTNDNWKNIYFQQNFNDVPITISRCQTYNGKQAVVTRQNNVKTSGFSVRLQEEEGNDDKHAIESIGYMAFVNIGSIQGDTIEPIVDKFYANPTTVNTNDSIMIGYTVTDETALKQVELYRKIDGGNWTKEKVQSVSGISDSGVFKDSIPNAGTYYYGIHVVGQANNIGKDRIKVIVNNPMGDNAPPSVNAGQDQSVTLPALVNRLVNLNGTVTDDNKPNPPSTVTVRWSKIRGPNNGVVVFGNATKKDTTASFSVAGIYELKLTANDSELTASDNVITIVTSTTSTPELKPYSSNKFYWQYKGRPVLLIGGFTGTHNMHVKPDDLNPPGNLTALMNKMVSAGGNYIRANFDPGKAILQGFPASHVKVNGKYNLNRLTSETDPISYWGKFNTLLAEAKKRNIIVQIEIWDHFDWDDPNWENSPFRPANNSNYTTSRSMLADSYESYKNNLFSSGVPGHPTYKSASASQKEKYDRVRGYQEKYVRHMVSIALKYDNVLYCMNNETHTHISWGKYWMNFIEDMAAAKGKKVYVTDMFDNGQTIQSSNEYDSAFAKPNVYTFLDVSQINSCNNKAGHEGHWNDLSYIRNKLKKSGIRPINNTKIYGANTQIPTDYHLDVYKHWGDLSGQNSFWMNILGGCASARFHRAPGGLSLSNKAMNSMKALRKLEQKMKMWDLQVHNDLLTSRGTFSHWVDKHKFDNEPFTYGEAYLAADPGKKYALYFTKGGSVRLKLDKYPGVSFDLDWINIDRGNWGLSTTIYGGGTVTITAPGSGAWVAAIVKSDN